MKSPQRTVVGLLILLAVCTSLFCLDGGGSAAMPERWAFSAEENPLIGSLSGDNRSPESGDAILGPFVDQSASPYVWEGDLCDLPQLPEIDRSPTNLLPPETIATWPDPSMETVDPLVQTWQGLSQMPAPIKNFAGLYNGEAGGPVNMPDTNGDVGPTYYIQVVNTAIGIFDKSSGSAVCKISFDNFFQGPPGSPCDNANGGDPVALYDAMADRWVITDFSHGNGSHECIAVSRTGDPVMGGWFFYDMNTSNVNGSWCDYPKLGVWPDAYYMSGNMLNPWRGAKVWALNRDDLFRGEPVDRVSFEVDTAYSLLPSNMKGALPPAGTPNYFASIEYPNTLHLWEFHVDWGNPFNSTFSGPTDLTVADFAQANDVPQQGTDVLLYGPTERLMFSLHYRNMGAYESLWANHSVDVNGVAGVRWYEIRDPGGTPILYQQGTFAPADGNHRWMGSVATDQDGNMAVGYSVSSMNMYPAISYAGRLNGETLGFLPQGENTLFQGTSFHDSMYWGDYSLMTVDPVDDCTFWYTNEYLEPDKSGISATWRTRIGSFKFPSCGQPKGWIAGRVYNSVTGLSIPGVPIVASVTGVTIMTVATDASGNFIFPLVEGTYDLTAGPLPPNYPTPATVSGVPVTPGNTTPRDIALVGMPYLEDTMVNVTDPPPGGNNNGYPEPGEAGLRLWVTIANNGAGDANNVTARLTSLTPGVTINVADAAYPNLPVGGAGQNAAPFEFSIDPSVPCGGQLDFQEDITTDQGTYHVNFSLLARFPLPIVHVFVDDMESGPGGWFPGPSQWNITEERAHSSTHAWSDSPGANYGNGSFTWLNSPAMKLGDATGTRVSFWSWYSLEADWDYGYVQYSLDDGASWQNLAVLNGQQESWVEENFDASVLDNQLLVRLRFLITSDTAMNYDGWYIDDVDVFYQPFTCNPPPALVIPPDAAIGGTHNAP